MRKAGRRRSIVQRKQDTFPNVVYVFRKSGKREALQVPIYAQATILSFDKFLVSQTSIGDVVLIGKEMYERIKVGLKKVYIG